MSYQNALILTWIEGLEKSQPAHWEPQDCRGLQDHISPMSCNE
jgi:hypothetical protein